MQVNQTPQWTKLEKLAMQMKSIHMLDLFDEDPSRSMHYSTEACGLHLDYSKNRITAEVLDTLFDLAKERQVSIMRDAMVGGEKINTTEDRAVLHTALRYFGDQPKYVDGNNVIPDVKNAREKMRQFVSSIHSGEHRGYTNKPIKHIVSIGIGGSFLGPKIVSEALKPYWKEEVNLHFVANVDGCHINDVLSELSHDETLIVMASKSFTTQETLQNTTSARDWFLQSGGRESDISKHFVAISSNIEAATAFGIAKNNIFPMWDWVGGRYSLWSAIGLPIALGIGFENFEQLLMGAADMDEHFCHAPEKQNIPMILALLGIWYRHFFAAQSHVLLPYYHYLRGLPAYIQQLDMESNGKQVTQSGQDLTHVTGPIIWGSEGTNGQHSFHQLLHQGADTIPVDFLFPMTALNTTDTHHQMLASNCFAQAQALMCGKTYTECYNDLKNIEISDGRRKTLARHKTMPGNKPSNMITFNALTPRILGTLIAMYEHKVFVQGQIWGINSFDQWGVELGKVLGNKILDSIQSSDPTVNMDIDSSTASAIDRFKRANQQNDR